MVPNLADLPQHLLELIVAKFEEGTGAKEVAQLRLVSKAFKLAAEQYDARLVVYTKRIKLQSLCRLWPNMQSLEIRGADSRVSLDWTESLTCLTSIDLPSRVPYYTRAPDRQASFSVNLLPKSLRRLRLQGVHHREVWQQNYLLPHLTALEIWWQNNMQPEAWAMLSRLPQLRVRRHHLIANL